MSPGRLFGPGAAEFAAPTPVSGEALPRTSLPVIQGHPQHLDAHLQRLEEGAAAMSEGLGWLSGLRDELQDWLASATGEEDLALRAVLHPAAGWLHVWLEPLPTAPQPYRLMAMPHPMSDRRADPALPHKGLAGPWNRDVLRAARALAAEDALLLWSDGTLAETAIASVGLEVSDVLLMPPPQGRVASLAERLELPAWAAARGLRIETAEIPLSHVGAGRIWCMNALRGIWSGELLSSAPVQAPAPGGLDGH